MEALYSAARRDFRFLNRAEALAGNIAFDYEPPKPKACQYCGKEIQYVGFVNRNKISRWILPSCKCKGAKEALEKKQELEMLEIVKKEQEAAKARKLERMLESCGMKKRFLNRTFENYSPKGKDQAKAFLIAQNYVKEWEKHKEEGEGLYFVGSNGTGKTHLAAAIALKLIPEKTSVIFRTAATLLSDIKQTFDSEVSEKQILQAYTEADLLIIDDLGKEQCTDWAISMLFTIINNRYEDCKPIVITSNYNLEDLVQALTPKGYNNDKAKAIVSRLKGSSKVVPMYWQDYRNK